MVRQKYKLEQTKYDADPLVIHITDCYESGTDLYEIKFWVCHETKEPPKSAHQWFSQFTFEEMIAKLHLHAKRDHMGILYIPTECGKQVAHFGVFKNLKL